MKCRFCGKKIKKNSNMCEYCGKEVNEGLGTDELIDAMPEIRDEFDKISELQEKDERKKERKEKRAKNKKRNIIIAVIIAAILSFAAGGTYYYLCVRPSEVSEKPDVLTSSAVASLFQKAFMSEGFTNLAAMDAASAKQTINGAKESFGIQDVEKEYELKSEMTVGDSKIYRFAQMYEGIPVFGGEVVIMADAAGAVKALNIAHVQTKGLTTDYVLDEGKASAAITDYINSLSDEFSIVNGVEISDVTKAVCNTENKAYLAYHANVSGYNLNGEYIAYDAFVDGISGNGICVVVTSSFETEASDAVVAEEVEESYIYELAMVNDKFNWNDSTIASAEEPLKISSITSGEASAYVTSVKSAVDEAYNFFDETYNWKGLSGNGESFKVYINPNEYVEENLPAEKAMYTNGSLMFFREDLTQGEIDYNTVVHEYAHGVIESIAGMCGTKQLNENAAIAEGLADVFAELAEVHSPEMITVTKEPESTEDTTGSEETESVSEPQSPRAIPDWVHGERNLGIPGEGYHISTDKAAEIYDIQDCYEYSTIVSHMAAFMDEYVDISIQNEIWFKALCLMTRHTDFTEFADIIKAIIDDLYAYSKIDLSQYESIKTGIEMLSASDEDLYSITGDRIY